MGSPLPELYDSGRPNGESIADSVDSRELGIGDGHGLQRSVAFYL